MELVSYPYARILHNLKSATLDLALIFKNSSISNDIDYIGPVSYSKIVVASQNNISVKSYADLKNLKNIAVIRNAEFNSDFDNDKSLHKVSVDSYQQAIRMLKHKRVDAVIGSLVGIDYALQQQNMSKNILQNALYISKKEWGLHISKSSQFQSLLPALKKAVQQTYQEDLIYQLYQQQLKTCL